MNLPAFIRAHRREILERWERRVERFSGAQELSRQELRNAMPTIIENLADYLERGESQFVNHTVQHAVERYSQPFSVSDVVLEYRSLRAAITEVLALRAAEVPSTELQQMHDLLDSAMATAVDVYSQEREDELRLFIGILGHDIRSPLMTVKSAADGVRRRGTLSPPEEKLLAQAGCAAERIEKLTSDLLDFARQRLGRQMPVQPQDLDLGELCRPLAEALQVAHPDRKVDVETDGDLSGRWDSGRLEQGLLNLLHNAIQHGRDDVRVIVDGNEADRVELSVVSGGSLSDAQLRAIENPMRGVESQRGVGLGLFIVNQVARAHGGDLDARSGGGEVRFTLSLPRHAQAHGE